MSHQAAIALGQGLRVLAVHPDDPAALVTPDVRLGAPGDLAAVRTFADGLAAVTFDHEQVPQEVLAALAAQGVALHPRPEALRHAQDKLVMRRRLGGLGIGVPAYAPVAAPADVTRFGAEHGAPVVVKAVRGGYDGRGVWLVTAPGSGEAEVLVRGLLDVGVPLMVEQCVAMRRELAVQVARSPYGQAAVWPVVQTVQLDGQCVEVLAPAPGLAQQAALGAQELAVRIAGELEVTGLLAVELFDTDAGLVVNELAMRPHNSGHWTIEGSRTSQFEQLLRAVLDYPLGATAMTAPAAVMANVLGADPAPAMGLDERLHHLFARMPEVKVHLYGKAERPDRKVGHVTALGTCPEQVRRCARLAARWLSTAQWADGWAPASAGTAGSAGVGQRPVFGARR